jgi:hypothetical protein
VTGRIEEHTPPFGCGLDLSDVGPQSLCLCNRAIQVVNCEVQVDLFWYVPVGPGRRSVVRQRWATFVALPAIRVYPRGYTAGKGPRTYEKSGPDEKSPY